jgi:hypothetical protein
LFLNLKLFFAILAAVMTIKTGKTIIPPSVLPERHELQAASLFASLGYDIEFLIPNRSKGIRTPDIKMNGILWEIKSPSGNSKYTLQHAFKNALKQSVNIIFDLRLMKAPEEKSITKLKNLFTASKNIKRLLIITKSLKLLDFKK